MRSTDGNASPASICLAWFKLMHICDKSEEENLQGDWGEVVAACWTHDGMLFVEGGCSGNEYIGRVDYCPFCGIKAERLVAEYRFDLWFGGAYLEVRRSRWTAKESKA